MPVEYQTTNVWQLLLELWLTYKEIQNLRELIHIDFQQVILLNDVLFIKNLMKFQFILKILGHLFFHLFFFFVYATKI